MNTYAVIILLALVAEYSLSLVAKVLNLNALTPAPPERLAGLYDASEYRRSQEYTRVRTRFDLLSGTFDLLLLLVFWFAGGFNALDSIVRGWGLGAIPTGLLYIALLLLGRGIIALPFEIYSTFVIEERFGFNKTTPAVFIVDKLKGVLLGVVLGVPLLAGILAFFEFAGPLAWLYCWLAATAFILIVQFIAPTWIMPLFNKFRPLEDGELRKSILSYAETVDFTLSNIFVIDGSRRSSKSNAFFTGFGRNKRVALYDTLIARHTVPELVSVVAHEIGHYKRKHILQGMVIGVLHTGVLFYLLSIFVGDPELFRAFYMENASIYAGLIFFGMLLSPVEMLLSILMQMLSRRNEFQADAYAVSTTQRPEALADALTKLGMNNLSNLTPHPFFVFLYYSHPPLVERIRAIETLRIS